MKDEDKREGAGRDGDARRIPEVSSVNPRELEDWLRGAAAPAERSPQAAGLDAASPVVELRCAEVRECLHRYVEGETEPFLSGLVEAHLSRCETCRGMRKRFEGERLWLLEVAIDTPQLSPNFRKKIRRRIEKDLREVHALRRREAFFRFSGVACAVLILALAAVNFQRRPPDEERVADVGRSDALPSRDLPPAGGVDSLLPPPEESIVDVVESPGPPFPSVLGEGLPSREPQRPPEQARLASHLNDVVSAALKLDRSRRPARGRGVEDPCRPDPNRDGKMDLNDVAYSCQVSLVGAPPEPLSESERAPSDPECEDLCLKV